MTYSKNRNTKKNIILVDFEDKTLAVEMSGDGVGRVIVAKPQAASKMSKKTASRKTGKSQIASDILPWTNPAKVFFGMNADMWRKSWGMSQREFAAMVGMSQSQINEILNGKARPQDANARKIAALIGMPVRALQAKPMFYGRIA